MIKSMTGFGRSEITGKNRKFTVEIKSVNHRYLDISIKIPKRLSFFESSIRSELKKYILRGKVDVFIGYEDYNVNTARLRFNKELADEYLHYFAVMAEEYHLDNDVRVSGLARFPEVFTMEEQSENEEELWKELCKAVAAAAKGFVETRVAEGERLKEDLACKLAGMLKLVDFIDARAPQVQILYRERLTQKVRELLEDSNVDESRILTETAVFADKICVDEETVRLRSHIEATQAALEQGGSVGRKLDFIAQEMNREANTILSKANDLEITNSAIELKTEIEKVREQIQNIE